MKGGATLLAVRPHVTNSNGAAAVSVTGTVFGPFGPHITVIRVAVSGHARYKFSDTGAPGAIAATDHLLPMGRGYMDFIVAASQQIRVAALTGTIDVSVSELTS